MPKRFWFVLLFFLGVITAVGINNLRASYSQVFVGQKKSATPNATPTPTDLLPAGSTYNILLLGYGGGNHDGPNLTDSMILARIDTAQKKVFLISIPRDIWVQIPDQNNIVSPQKINSAYAYGLNSGPAGGGEAAIAAVATVTGITPQKFVAVNFDGFVKTIDALGGIDVKVDSAFTDPEYPLDGHETDLCGKTQDDLPTLLQIAATSSATAFPCRYQTLDFTAGTHRMDGITALAFARSRHSQTDGSDFNRSRRQKNVLVAIKQKVLSLGFITKAIPFLASLKNDVVTDFSPGEITYFIGRSKELSQYDIVSIAMDDSNIFADDFSSDGQYILRPKAGLFNWNSVQSWLASQMLANPSPTP
jgi:polyisoprenyl-teichoic acid--peptidoglycan teichoic acid transferase